MKRTPIHNIAIKSIKGRLLIERAEDKENKENRGMLKEYL